jgi:hypothetical protein
MIKLNVFESDSIFAIWQNVKPQSQIADYNLAIDT